MCEEKEKLLKPPKKKETKRFYIDYKFHDPAKIKCSRIFNHTWRNKYRTEDGRDKSLKVLKRRGNFIIEVGKL